MLETDPVAVTVPSFVKRTELERSAAFRAYTARLSDGLEHLDQQRQRSAPGAAVVVAA